MAILPKQLKIIAYDKGTRRQDYQASAGYS